jgi:hypothetical protein
MRNESGRDVAPENGTLGLFPLRWSVGRRSGGNDSSKVLNRLN